MRPRRRVCVCVWEGLDDPLLEFPPSFSRSASPVWSGSSQVFAPSSVTSKVAPREGLVRPGARHLGERETRR